MVDSNPTDHTAHSTSPAASLSADEIAEMRREIDVALSKSDAEFPFHALAAARHLPRLLSALEALTAENARLTEQLGKYAMPPWEADRHKREALAARRALCLGEHADNVAPADIYDRIVALRTAKETYREDVR